MSYRTLGDELIALKTRSRMTLTAIAHAAGYSGASSVQAFFHTNYDPPGLDRTVAQKLASAFAGRGEPPITADEVFELLRVGDAFNKPTTSNDAAAPTARKNFLDSDVPVFENKRNFGGVRPIEPLAGLSTSIMRMDNPLRYYPRASGLAWNDNAFCLHVVGTTMDPRFRDGEPLFVSHSRDPAVGDDVIVYLNTASFESPEQSAALIAMGRLMDVDGTRVAVMQYGSQRTTGIAHRLFSRIERIASWAEVCGLPYA